MSSIVVVEVKSQELDDDYYESEDEDGEIVIRKKISSKEIKRIVDLI
jgi:hypothetical protein